MDAKEKRIMCSACNIQVGRLGWEAVRLPRTAEGCQALQKMVWGTDVPKNLEPCFLIDASGIVHWQTSEENPLPRGIGEIPFQHDLPEMEVSESSIRFGGSKRARAQANRDAKSGT